MDDSLWKYEYEVEHERLLKSQAENKKLQGALEKIRILSFRRRDRYDIYFKIALKNIHHIAEKALKKDTVKSSWDLLPEDKQALKDGE